MSTRQNFWAIWKNQTQSGRHASSKPLPASDPFQRFDSHPDLRRERMCRKITQEKLARLVDLNICTIQKIEAGHMNILLTTVLRLRKALGCSWEALMEK